MFCSRVLHPKINLQQRLVLKGLIIFLLVTFRCLPSTIYVHITIIVIFDICTLAKALYPLVITDKSFLYVMSLVWDLFVIHSLIKTLGKMGYNTCPQTLLWPKVKVKFEDKGWLLSRIVIGVTVILNFKCKCHMFTCHWERMQKAISFTEKVLQRSGVVPNVYLQKIQWVEFQ